MVSTSQPLSANAIAAAKDPGQIGAHEQIPLLDRTGQRAVDAFRAQYSIRILGENKISVTLPPGTSRADFLRDVTLYSEIVHGKAIVNRADLKSFTQDSRFTEVIDSECTLAIDGNAPMERGRRYEVKASLSSRGFTQTKEEDFLVAAAAYKFLTGKDFFKGAMHVDRGIFYLELDAGEPNRGLINKHSDMHVYGLGGPLNREHVTSIYLAVPSKPPYPSAAERAHQNALRDPTGDPDEAARQDKY
jgi:hypothetical protein